MQIAPTVARRRFGWDIVGYAISMGLVAVACYVLYRILGDIDFGKVGTALRTTPPGTIIVAFLLVLASYLTLTFYDFFALRTLGDGHIPSLIAAYTGVLSYTIGHNIGATVLSAGLVRLRMYRSWGLDLSDVAKIAFMTGLTFWLGNAFVLGIGLACAPETASAINQLPAWSNRMLAVATLALIGAYLLWLIPRPRVLGRNGWKVQPPGARLTLVQIGIGVADLLLSALAMAVLISAHVPVDLLGPVVA